MDGQKTDIDQIIENIIKAKFFNQEEQKILADLFKEEGVSEAFLQKVKEMFETAVKKTAKEGKPIITNFEEQTEAAEQEMQGQRPALLNELENKLSKVSDDDFEQRGKLLQEHSQVVLAQYGALEQKIRDIAAKILAEYIKMAD